MTIKTLAYIIVAYTTVAVATIMEVNIMIMADLSIIGRYSRTYFERRLSEINVGFTEQLILMHLYKCESINQESIAKHFMLDKGAIAKTLSKLEEKDFITRKDNPNNKREKLITITPKGQSIIGYMDEELQEWHNYLFKGLSTEDIKQFTTIVEKISANAVNAINRGKPGNEDSE